MPFLAAIPAAAAIGAAAPAVGSIVGGIAAHGDQQSADEARKAALQQILNVNIPDIEQQKVALQNQHVVGQLDPQQEGLVQQGPSAMEGISTDPRLAQAQMQALQQMQGLGNTGLSATDRAALFQIQNKTAGDSQAAQQAILANMQARGMGGGGAELAARLSASQNAANSGANQSLQIASQAQQKALQAMMNAGTMGTQMRSQQFGEQSDVAKAKDAIQQFNAANKQQVMGTNTSANNASQAANLANAQSVANTNTGTANQQEAYNKSLYQQQFQNQMSKANAASGAENTAAKGYQDAANATRQQWGQVGQGVGSGVAALANYKPSTPAAPASNMASTDQWADYTGASKKVNPNAANGDWSAI